MTRYKNIVQKWKYDEVDAENKSGTSEDKKSANRSYEKDAPGQRLQELKNSDFKLADHHPDISGWDVVDEKGIRVGIVRDFLFEQEALKVRYLIVNIDEGKTSEEKTDILIPIGKARLNREKENIELFNFSKEKLSDVPVYRNTKSLAREDEKRTLQAFTGGTNQELGEDNNYSDEKFYDHRDFNEDDFYGPEKSK